MLSIVQVLDGTITTGNPIFIIDTATGLPFAGNKIANDLFAEYTNKFDFFKIFNKEMSIELFMIIENFTGEKVIEDCVLTTQRRDVLHCSLEFTYAKHTKEAILLLVKIKEDHRPHYLNVLLNHMKRPAFLLECVTKEETELVIHQANQLFYHAFACSEETIGEKYDNLFQKMISSEGRDQYIREILESIRGSGSGIIKVPIQTVDNQKLALYFSHSLIRPLLEKEDRRFICQLVQLNETVEEIECPFDRDY